MLQQVLADGEDMRLAARNAFLEPVHARVERHVWRVQCHHPFINGEARGREFCCQLACQRRLAGALWAEYQVNGRHHATRAFCMISRTR